MAGNSLFKAKQKQLYNRIFKLTLFQKRAMRNIIVMCAFSLLLLLF